MIIQTLAERNRFKKAQKDGFLDLIMRNMIAMDIEKFDNRRLYKISINQIEDVVCDQQEINKEALHAKSRKRELVQARQIIYYFSREYTRETLEIRGSYFNQDHATVTHGIKTISGLSENNKEIQIDLKIIRDKLDLIGCKQLEYPKRNADYVKFSNDPANFSKLLN